MLVAVTCAARRRRVHCRGCDTAAAAMELDRGQQGPGDYCGHRWRDEPAPVGMPGGREQTRRQGRQRRDGGPALVGSRRRQRHAVAAGAQQAPSPAEAGSQPGPGSSAAVVSRKKAPAAGEARAGVETASAAAALSSEAAASLPTVLCAVCLEEVPTEAEVTTTLPCSHSYHAGCVLPWLAARGACPCCRATLPSPENCIFSSKPALYINL